MKTGLLAQILLVGAGGFIGSVSRFLLSECVQRYSKVVPVPLGILVVNVLGCLCIGLFAGAVVSRRDVSDSLQLFVAIGLLGGFTTFSSFGLQTLLLFRAGNVTAALLNILLQVTIGLGAAWLGYSLASVRMS